MNKLPLSVCVQTFDTNGAEYDVDIVHLGVPNAGRVYTLSDLTALESNADLYFRFVPMQHTVITCKCY